MNANVMTANRPITYAGRAAQTEVRPVPGDRPEDQVARTDEERGDRERDRERDRAWR